MKKTKTFPYEMTELISEDERELQETLRREVRKMELEMRCNCSLRRVAGESRCLRLIAAGN